MQPRISHLLLKNQRIYESTNLRIEARSDFGWLGGIRLFVITQIHLPDSCVPTSDTQM